MLPESVIFGLGCGLGYVVGSFVESQLLQKRSIPPSESLDTQKRMTRIAAGKEDVNAFHVRRNTLDLRSRKYNEADGTDSLRSEEKSRGYRPL